jgi:hypothetical protein
MNAVSSIQQGCIFTLWGGFIKHLSNRRFPIFIHIILKYLGLHIWCCLHRLYTLLNVFSNVARGFFSPVYPDWLKGRVSLNKAAGA